MAILRRHSLWTAPKHLVIILAIYLMRNLKNMPGLHNVQRGHLLLSILFLYMGPKIVVYSLFHLVLRCFSQKFL